MVKHSKIGIKGEQLAAEFLLNKGYKILHKNWRSGQKEVDLIAKYKDTIVFVEVKTRSKQTLQFPEESVSRVKQNNLRLAAMAYADKSEHNINIRFDIIAILMQQEHAKEIIHFEEAFY